MALTHGAPVSLQWGNAGRCVQRAASLDAPDVCAKLHTVLTLEYLCLLKRLSNFLVNSCRLAPQRV
jgi:hypothetical protein